MAEDQATVLEAANVGVGGRAGLPERVLAEVGGDRRLTDLRHIGEALHEVTLTERHGLVSLLTWLREQVAEGRAGRGVERTRRLDSDAAAVQLVTIHASKGLQFPVVLLPFASDEFFGGRKETCSFHAASGERMIDVRGGGPGWRDHVETDLAEQLGESLRRLYVAVTRAQCKVQLAGKLYLIRQPERCKAGEQLQLDAVIRQRASRRDGPFRDSGRAVSRCGTVRGCPRRQFCRGEERAGGRRGQDQPSELYRRC